MMKKVQQMRTMLPIGRSDDSSVCTTSFRPGALLITLHSSQAVRLCISSICTIHDFTVRITQVKLLRHSK